MKISASRKLLITSLALVFLSMLSGLIINLLTNNADLTEWLKKNYVETRHLVGGAIVTGFCLLTLAYLQFQYDRVVKQTDLTGQDIGPDVKRFADSLKERYESRYRQKLDGRFEITLEVSENLETQSPRKYNEKYERNNHVSPAFAHISNSFERKGRLLIVGEPGVGKTVLLLKLALNLLDEIDLIEKEAFPVIFNLASWSSKYERFEDWLIEMLVSGNGLSRTLAEKLIVEGRISLLLDGLDELAKNEPLDVAARERAHCLRSLNTYLDRGKKAIVSCRLKDFRQLLDATGQKAPAAALVRVLTLTKAEVLLALEHASVHEEMRHHAAARNLLRLLAETKNENFLEVLRTPFYFTTAIEIFDRELIEEEIYPVNQQDIRKYLIDRFVEKKTGDKSRNVHGFSKFQTYRWLMLFANFLERKRRINFELADLQPTDLGRPWVFKFLFSTGMAFLFSLIFCSIAYIIGPPRQSDTWLKESLVFFIIIIVVMILVLPFWLLYSFRIKDISTEDRSRLSLRPLLEFETWKSILISSLLYSLTVFLLGLVFYSNQISIPIQLSLTIFSFTLVERTSSYCRVIEQFKYLEKPYQRLRMGIAVGVIRWVLIGLAWIVAIRIFVAGDRWNSIDWKGMPIFILVIMILSLINTAFFKHFVLRLWFWALNIIPLRCAGFLDYATKLRILERDGGFWRFRHQNLQEYFANPGPGTGTS
jgi:energy-coupling factor transporter ATP-binding protein EcfA2